MQACGRCLRSPRCKSPKGLPGAKAPEPRPRPPPSTFFKPSGETLACVLLYSSFPIPEGKPQKEKLHCLQVPRALNCIWNKSQERHPSHANPGRARESQAFATRTGRPSGSTAQRSKDCPSSTFHFVWKANPKEMMTDGSRVPSVVSATREALNKCWAGKTQCKGAERRFCRTRFFRLLPRPWALGARQGHTVP